jgi:NADH-quinone oxidoreductase subunit N
MRPLLKELKTARLDIDMMTRELIDLLPLWLVTAGAIGLLFNEAVMKEGGRHLAPYLAILFTAAALAFGVNTVIDVGSERHVLFHGSVVVDWFSATLVCISVLSALLAILFSVQYLKQERAVTGEYYALILLAVAGMITLVVAAEFLTLFVGVELVSLAGYVLAGYFRVRERSIEAALKYYLPGIFATGFLLFGIATVYGASGSTFFSEIYAKLEISSMDSMVLGLAAVLLLSGFAFKVAVAPFHAWAPDVYDGAAAPVTAFLSTGVKAAAFAGLARVFLSVFKMPGTWLEAFAILSVLTMVVGNVGALVQKSVKRMLAYSSVAHAGYVLIAFTAVKRVDASEFQHAVAVYMLAYTLMTGGAFGLLAYAGREGEKRTDLIDLAGMSFQRPWMAITMSVFMFSLAGFPPTAGFFGKYFIFKLAVENGYVWLAIAGVLNSFLSAYYYLRVVVYMFMEQQTDTESIPQPSFLLMVGLFISVAGTFLAGFLPPV